VVNILHHRGINYQVAAAKGYPIRDLGHHGPPVQIPGQGQADSWGNGHGNDRVPHLGRFYYCTTQPGHFIIDNDGQSCTVVYNNMPKGSDVVQEIIFVSENDIKAIN